MSFTNKTFQEVNSSTNKLQVTKLFSFDGKVTSSGLSIKLPIQGTEHYYLNNKYHPLNKGKFLVVNRGEEVACSFQSDILVESVCLYLDHESYLSTIDTLLSPDVLERKDSYAESEVISDTYYFEENNLSLTLDTFLKKKDSISLTESDFFLITEQLAYHQLQQHGLLDEIKAQKNATKKELLSRLRKAHFFLTENYQKEIDLSELSKVCLLSKYHLLRSFKSVYKVTPYSFLTNVRVKKAKEFLEKGSDIFDVAHSCGFNDRRSFSRTFKQITGISPSVYQRNLRKKVY